MHDHGRIIATAILPTRDIDGAIDFYRGLGFAVDRFSDRYALVLFEGHEVLHLEGASDTTKW